MVEKNNILGPDLRARVGLRKKLGLADLRTCIKGSQDNRETTDFPDLALSVVETSGYHQTGVQSNGKSRSTG